MEDILSSIRRVIARDEAPASSRERGAVLDDEDDVLDLGDAESHAADPVDDKDELVSPDSVDAARKSIEALAAAVTPAAAAAVASPPRGEARTIEDVVVEALRPMLKEWLDTNLPPLVETLVAREISRITGNKRN